ncbi:hypothetical protein ACW9UR_11385 [Halovulum sp. GXIMD14794]
MKPAITALICLAVAACGGPKQQIAFTSQQEQACYERVSASLPEGRTLQRNADGWFMEVTTVNAQVRDVRTSAAFNQCMATIVPENAISDMGTITFSPQDQAIWDSLTDDAKRDALIYMRGGGTLQEFVAL